MGGENGVVLASMLHIGGQRERALGNTTCMYEKRDCRSSSGVAGKTEFQGDAHDKRWRDRTIVYRPHGIPSIASCACVKKHASNRPNVRSHEHVVVQKAI